MQEYIHKINKTLALTKNITSSVTGRTSKYIVILSIFENFSPIYVWTNKHCMWHLDYIELCMYIISKLLKEWYLFTKFAFHITSLNTAKHKIYNCHTNPQILSAQRASNYFFCLPFIQICSMLWYMKWLGKISAMGSYWYYKY